MSPRLSSGYRENIAHDYGWVVDLEPDQRMALLLSHDMPNVVPLAHGPPASVFDDSVVLVDLRASTDTVAISVGRIATDKRQVFSGPWLVNPNPPIRDILQIYRDAVLENRDRNAAEILEQVLADYAGRVRGMLRPIIVKVRDPFRVSAMLLPGAPAITGVRIHLRTIHSREHGGYPE